MKLSHVVLIADGTPDSTNESILMDEVSFDNPVPVTINFDRRYPPIGKAVLRKDGEQLIADIDVEDENAIESRGLFVGYTPAIGARCETPIRRSESQSAIALIGVKITEITLSESSNSDSRIKPIMQ